MQKKYFNRRGSILMYALLLVNFAVILGYIIFLKSQTLYENTRYMQYSSKLSENIEERGTISIKYDTFFNANGSGFIDTRSCPSLTMSGTATGSTYFENIVTIPYFTGSILTCSGTSTIYSGEVATLNYSPDYLSFSGITFRANSSNFNGITTLSGKLADSDESLTTFTLGSMSNLDNNFNSDNYQSNSSGNITYPDRYLDDDDLARKVHYGYIRGDGKWRNIFWNTYISAAHIRKNSNNTGSLVIFPDETSTGILQLQLDAAYSIKVVEFDPDTYMGTKELKVINSISGLSSTGVTGYLQSDMTILSGSTNAKIFDLKNKNYGIFLASSGSSLTYKISFVNQSGGLIYTAPLDDSHPNQITYYGNDIVIDSDNNYVSKEQTIILPK